MKASFARPLLLALALGLAAQAQAQQYPSRPVRVITASPGSPQDVVARIVGQKLSEMWGQGVPIENKAGAGSLLSIQSALAAPPDGYSILVVSSAYAITPALYPEVKFDAEKDLVPVAMLAVSPNVIVGAPQFKGKSLQEVINQAKAGTRMQFGSPGIGTAPALVMEYLVKVSAKVDIGHVPYKGAVAPMTAASTGEVALASTGLAPAMPFIKAGKVQALAVTSGKRTPALTCRPWPKPASPRSRTSSGSAPGFRQRRPTRSSSDSPRTCPRRRRCRTPGIASPAWATKCAP
jgi:tripartite-type tricarboxylate transporter receptor subunit TctC